MIKEHKTNRRIPAAALGGLLLSLGFWGIVFPQYLFTGDCVRILDEEGQDVTEEAEEDRNLYLAIEGAEPGQIEVKISILEWQKDKAKGY